MDLEDQIGNQDILIIRKRVALKDKSVVANQETVSGWTSYYKVALEPTKLKKVLEESLTSDEMRELQQYIDFAPEDADARNFPAGYTQMKFGFELPKFTATVRQVQVTGREIDVFQFWTKDISTRFVEISLPSTIKYFGCGDGVIWMINLGLRCIRQRKECGRRWCWVTWA